MNDDAVYAGLILAVSAAHRRMRNSTASGLALMLEAADNCRRRVVDGEAWGPVIRDEFTDMAWRDNFLKKLGV